MKPWVALVCELRPSSNYAQPHSATIMLQEKRSIEKIAINVLPR